MKREDLNNLLTSWKSVTEKKLDPVSDKENDKKFKDRKDKDIDNDGDVDKSDKFLHKRRKAIDNEIDGGEKPAESCGGSHDKKKRNEEVDLEEATASLYKSMPKDIGKAISNRVQVKAFKDENAMSSFLAKQSDDSWKRTDVSGLKSGRYKLNMVKKNGKPSREFIKVNEDYESGSFVFHTDYGHGEIVQETEDGIDVMFESEIVKGMDLTSSKFIKEASKIGSIKKAVRVPGDGGEKHGETQAKGEAEFAKKLGKDGETVGTEEEDGVADNAKAAASVKSQAPTRGNEKRIGDKSIVKPVK